ncbi:MAG: hypothetical protein HGA45_26675 [Chloroflexales bacterium]|nr:hypothetical protein [Chloroflexales bacterium]
MEIYQYDFPGRNLRFELPLAESSAPQLAVVFAGEALKLCCENFITPLSADLELSYFDAELEYTLDDPQPAQRFWFLRSMEAPPEAVLAPAWVNPVEESVSSIDASTFHSWLIKVLEQSHAKTEPGDGSAIVGYKEILIRATRVQLPWASSEVVEPTLKLWAGARSREHPIERSDETLFVSGPLGQRSHTAPIDLRITSELGVMTLDINVYWSLWTDSGQKGWLQLQAMAERLREAGWVCTYSQIEGIDPQR